MAVQTVTGDTLEAFHAEKLGLSSPTAKSEPEPKKEATDEPKTDDVELKAEESEPEEKEDSPKKHNPKLQNRFSQLTAAKREAEAKALQAQERAEAAERKAKELEDRLNPPKKEENKRPAKEDFTDAFEYAEALASWSAQDALAQRDLKDREEKAQRERDKVVDAWKGRVTEAKERMPDWDDMVASSQIAVSDDVRDAIIESDHGPDILYLLASEPEIADKLNGLSVRGQLKEIGRLEAKFERLGEKEEKEPNSIADIAKVEEVSEKPRAKAPAPITPVKGTRAADNPVTDTADFKGSFAEWKAARLAMQHKANR